MSEKLNQFYDMLIFPERLQQLLQDAKTEAEIVDTLLPILQQIENELRLQNGRTKCSILLDVDKTPANMLTDLTGDSKIPIVSSHDDKTKMHVLIYNPKKYGIVLAASLQHESQHANQWDGKDVAADERTMYHLAKALYDKGPSVQYYNNYAEMGARLAEAQFYIQTYERLKETNPEFIKSNAFLRPLKQMRFELMASVSIDTMTALNQRNIERIQNHQYRSWYLKAATPGFGKHEEKAIQFLQTHGMRLYRDMFRQLQRQNQIIEGIINDIEQQITTEQKHIENAARVEDRLMMQSIATQYPQVVEMPYPSPTMQFAVYDSKALQQKLDFCAQGHNLAIYIESNGNMTVFADLQPIPRSYSTDPQLRLQWLQEHPEEHSGKTHDKIDGNLEERND